MSFRSFLRRLAASARPASPISARGRTRPAVELLEDRVVPYAVTGNAWPHANLITLSFMPDGTSLGGAVASNLQGAFNANPFLNQAGPANWKNQVLKAAQAWAQQANINFAVVADDGAPSGSGGYQQGDPGFGDIRIGGYNFGNSALASAYQPPPANNYSIAGDIAFNTGAAWRENGTYDLFTVALHELGHALGLAHSAGSTANALYPSYTGVKAGLAADDINGIRAVYGSRHSDAYGGANNSITAAANVSALINAGTLTALVPDLSITTAATVEDFSFQVPAGTGGTMTIKVQSQGLSQLSPKVTVFAADGVTVIGSASGINQYGTTLTVTASGVTAGQTYYVQVQGADTTAFGTGLYALALNFGTGATPAEASPVIPTANGSPLSGSGGCANGGAAGDTLLDSVPTITGVTPDTGASSADGITKARNITLQGVAPEGTTVQVFLNTLDTTTNTWQSIFLGTATGSFGDNCWTFDDTGTTLADGTYNFTADAVDASGNVSGMSSTFVVTVDTTAPAAPAIQSGSLTSGPSTPTISGTATAFTAVTVYRTAAGGKPQVAAAVPVTSQGTWTFTEGSALANATYTYTAVAADAAGNVSAPSAGYNVSVNATSPSPSKNTGKNSTSTQQSAMTVAPNATAGTITSGGVTATPNPSTNTWTLSGNGKAGHTIVIMNGNTVVGTTVVANNGSWSLTLVPLPSGQNTLSVFDVDATGDATPITALTITS